IRLVSIVAGLFVNWVEVRVPGRGRVQGCRGERSLVVVRGQRRSRNKDQSHGGQRNRQEIEHVAPPPGRCRKGRLLPVIARPAAERGGILERVVEASHSAD